MPFVDTQQLKQTCSQIFAGRWWWRWRCWWTQARMHLLMHFHRSQYFHATPQHPGKVVVKGNALRRFTSGLQHTAQLYICTLHSCTVHTAQLQTAHFTTAQLHTSKCARSDVMKTQKKVLVLGRVCAVVVPLCHNATCKIALCGSIFKNLTRFYWVPFQIFNRATSYLILSSLSSYFIFKVQKLKLWTDLEGLTVE